MNKIKSFFAQSLLCRFFLYEVIFTIFFIRDVFIDIFYVIKNTWTDYRHNVAVLKQNDREKM